ncbi:MULTISPECIES: hypothetical protein [unclassified Bacteroides]|uniref:hypothetical protein n=1 Tax=unclassified Bacteroides TaxID=2646097 RepID=UPI00168B5842|nr:MULTISPECIES: hypothetical protein [unclassified Bacteroides]MBD3591117.1 hypothetical protein [Bacteroides sp. GM023]
MMDSREALKANGFTGFKTMQELMENNLCIPKEMGVYAVLRENKDSPTFLVHGTGGFFKGDNPNVSIETLQNEWVEDTDILYIGKAGGTESNATLYSRLRQYLQFGQEKAVGHKGGRYIWQLKDSRSLIVCWKVLVHEEPRNVEREMIQAFKSDHQFKRPFANLQD